MKRAAVYKTTAVIQAKLIKNANVPSINFFTDTKIPAATIKRFEEIIQIRWLRRKVRFYLRRLPFLRRAAQRGFRRRIFW